MSKTDGGGIIVVRPGSDAARAILHAYAGEVQRAQTYRQHRRFVCLMAALTAGYLTAAGALLAFVLRIAQ